MAVSLQTQSIANVEDLIRLHATNIAIAMPEIVRDAQNEAGIRQDCTELLKNFLKDAGIKVKPVHEYGLAGGRIDSKYGGVIIEYKNPHTNDRIGPRLESHGTNAAIKQIEERFESFESEENLSKDRIFACGLDGRTIIFVRHRGAQFEIETPQPITPLTVERLLRALLSLGATGKSYSPDNLERDFGANANSAQECVKALYAAICVTQNDKAKTFFEQWKILFGEVCGYDVTKVNEKVGKLAKHYGIVSSPKAGELLFSIHTYYSIFIKLLASEIVANFAGFATSVVKRCVGTASNSALKKKFRHWKMVEAGNRGALTISWKAICSLGT
jgi:hypothetical protein